MITKISSTVPRFSDGAVPFDVFMKCAGTVMDFSLVAGLPSGPTTTRPCGFAILKDKITQAWVICPLCDRRGLSHELKPRRINYQASNDG